MFFSNEAKTAPAATSGGGGGQEGLHLCVEEGPCSSLLSSTRQPPGVTGVITSQAKRTVTAKLD